MQQNSSWKNLVWAWFGLSSSLGRHTEVRASREAFRSADTHSWMLSRRSSPGVPPPSDMTSTSRSRTGALFSKNPTSRRSRHVPLKCTTLMKVSWPRTISWPNLMSLSSSSSSSSVDAVAELLPSEGLLESCSYISKFSC